MNIFWKMWSYSELVSAWINFIGGKCFENFLADIRGDVNVHTVSVCYNLIGQKEGINLELLFEQLEHELQKFPHDRRLEVKK